jgi:hypothetical protein
MRKGNSFINFRECHLTMLLKTGLTNSKAIFIACVNSTISADNQTSETLEVAKRCSKIKTKVVANINIEAGDRRANDAELLRLQEENDQ